jgi:hypothetical protein
MWISVTPSREAPLGDSPSAAHERVEGRVGRNLHHDTIFAGSRTLRLVPPPTTNIMDNSVIV